jgi:hypothetical protein
MKDFTFLKVHGYLDRMLPPSAPWKGTWTLENDIFPTKKKNATESLPFNGKFDVFRKQLHLRANCC